MTTQFHPSPWYQSILKQLRSRWLIGVLLAGGIAGGGFGIYRTFAPSQNAELQMETTTAQQKTLSITISANGTIKPQRTINLSPKTSGYLRQLLVKEGDRVQEGQIVAYMDNSNLQGQLTQSGAQVAQQQANLNKLLNGNRPEDIAQSQAQLTEAQAQLQQLETGNRPEDIAQAQAQLSKAQADLRAAEDDLQRNQSLLSAGAITAQTVVQKRSARDAAQATVNQAQSALKLQQSGSRLEEIEQARSQVEQRQQALNLLKAGARPEDIDAARAQVEAARGALQTIQAQLNDTIVKAPFTGIVTKKYSDTIVKAPFTGIVTKKYSDTRSGGFSNPTQGTTENTAKVVRTRPIFPYPMQARYSGKGSVDEAANFVGVMPSQSVNGGFALTQSADRINWIGNDLLQPR